MGQRLGGGAAVMSGWAHRVKGGVAATWAEIGLSKASAQFPVTVRTGVTRDCTYAARISLEAAKELRRALTRAIRQAEKEAKK